jgi:hypothetical protein
MDHPRAYALSIIATPNVRNTMMTAGYRTSDASNRRKRGCTPCFGMPMINRSTPTTKSTRRLPTFQAFGIPPIGGFAKYCMASPRTSQCPLLALSGHRLVRCTCPLLTDKALSYNAPTSIVAIKLVVLREVSALGGVVCNGLDRISWWPFYFEALRKGNVRLWHSADMGCCSANVCF